MAKNNKKKVVMVHGTLANVSVEEGGLRLVFAPGAQCTAKRRYQGLKQGYNSLLVRDPHTAVQPGDYVTAKVAIKGSLASFFGDIEMSDQGEPVPPERRSYRVTDVTVKPGDPSL